MRIVFHSKDSFDSKVFFRTNGSKNGNIITFDDLSIPNTKIEIEIKENELIFKRKGNINMILPLKLNEFTNGYYNNEDLLEMPLLVKTNNLCINNKRIEIEYILYLDNEPFSTHKIWILFE